MLETLYRYYLNRLALILKPHQSRYQGWPWPVGVFSNLVSRKRSSFYFSPHHTFDKSKDRIRGIQAMRNNGVANLGVIPYGNRVSSIDASVCVVSHP